jgi:hypothetical protein
MQCTLIWTLVLTLAFLKLSTEVANLATVAASFSSTVACVSGDDNSSS